MIGKVVEVNPEKRSCEVQINAQKTLPVVFYLLKNGQVTPKKGDLVQIEIKNRWWEVVEIIENNLHAGEGTWICHTENLDLQIGGEQAFISTGAGWFC